MFGILSAASTKPNYSGSRAPMPLVVIEYYAGLTGLEFYAAGGTEIAAFESVSASGAVLANDPQSVHNLVDGVNRTCNECNMWAAPFVKGKPLTATLKFTNVVSVATIRVWNYNSSRVYASRGARHIIIALDDAVIFNGEVGRAPGDVRPSRSGYGELILFTSNPEVLNRVAAADKAIAAERAALNPTVDPGPELEDRPSTAGKTLVGAEGGLGQVSSSPLSVSHVEVDGGGGRDGGSRTEAVDADAAADADADADTGADADADSTPHLVASLLQPTPLLPPPMVPSVEGRLLRLNMLETWGDPYYIGLTGISFWGPPPLGSDDDDLVPIVLPNGVEQMEASPRDLNELSGR